MCIRDSAQNVWRTFGIRTLGEYHDLYLKTDVLLLADVFEVFREMAMRYYQIDPAHLYSLPGVAWHAMLKMTGVRPVSYTHLDVYKRQTYNVVPVLMHFRDYDVIVLR